MKLINPIIAEYFTDLFSLFPYLEQVEWQGGEVFLLDYFKKLIEQALEKTGLDALDYLLFHSMNMAMFKKRGRQFRSNGRVKRCSYNARCFKSAPKTKAAASSWA